jgi:type I restriction enzyme S subunit
MATTVIHIGKKDFDSFEISLPNEEVLNQFDDTTAPLLNRIIANSYENKRLEQLRDLLLPKLMSGEIDVSDVEI